MAKTAMVLSPAELVCAAIAAGEKKAGLVWRKQVLLGILAGAFIAFASAASNMAAFHLLGRPETYGLGKCLAGAIFPVGLILVVVAGGELFTGNTLIGVAAAEGRVRLGALLCNWIFVYAGNFTGSVLIAHMTYASGLLASGAGELGGVTIKIAFYKTFLEFITSASCAIGSCALPYGWHGRRGTWRASSSPFISPLCITSRQTFLPRQIPCLPPLRGFFPRRWKGSAGGVPGKQSPPRNAGKYRGRSVLRRHGVLVCLP